MVATETKPGPGERTRVELTVGGMTCASCAMRIEKRLNRLEGVTATVNYATERARVDFPAGVEPAQLIAAVEAIGYQAALPVPTSSLSQSEQNRTEEYPAAEGDQTQPLRNRLVVAGLLSLPVLVMAMVPALQFLNWQWLSLTLAAPVVVWGALPFHRAAWANLRHASATMDTLISVGTLAAFGWSLWALFFGDAGQPGMTMAFDLTIQRGSGTHEIYLEVASAVTVFILAGRYFEARAKRR